MKCLGYIIFFVWCVLMLGFGLNVMFIRESVTPYYCSIHGYNDKVNNNGIIQTQLNLTNLTELANCFNVCRSGGFQ